MDFKELKRQPNESEKQFIYRICSMKEAIGDWCDVADIINKALNLNYGESAYRKPYQNFVNSLEELKPILFPAASENKEVLDSFKEQLRAIEIEKIKLREERLDYQRTRKEVARRESFLEAVERVISEKFEPVGFIPSPVIQNDDDMIVGLCDLHTGIDFSNWWNSYNTQVLRERLCKYASNIIAIQKTHGCKICYVVLGGDNISGMIHKNLRLQNKENIIQQVKIATELISEFLSHLIPLFEKTIVYSMAGNHSRINPNKEDHLTGEELDELITYCLSLKFPYGVNKIHIDTASRIDDTVGAFTTRGGKLIYYTHGDKDTPNTVLKDLTLMIGKKPDAIIMGHRHHNAYDTQHGVKIIQCGSVVGADMFCIDHRISGLPEQCVVITNDKKVLKCLYDINLE